MDYEVGYGKPPLHTRSQGAIGEPDRSAAASEGSRSGAADRARRAGAWVQGKEAGNAAAHRDGGWTTAPRDLARGDRRRSHRTGGGRPPARNAPADRADAPTRTARAGARR